MTKRPVTNTAASVRQRLLNLARANGRSFNEVVQHYALERWLYRLSRSDHAARFVLKGALLLRVWAVPVARPTRDIDLLAHTGNDLDAIRGVVGDICQTAVEPDGMEFDPGTVVTERISEDAEDTAAVCFTDDCARQDSKAVQWRAFVRRSGLRDVPESFPAVWQSAMAFLRPVAEAVERGVPLEAAWPAGGPWQPGP